MKRKAKAAIPKASISTWRVRYQKTQKRIAARISADPRAAINEGYEAIDYGVEMLLKLIESKALFHKMVSRDGTEDHSHDEAISCLCSRADWIAGKIAEFARAGDPAALIRVWCGAKQYAEVVHYVATTKPQRLRLLAGNSLFVPSLRAKSKTFTHDFKQVAEAIGLSQECNINMDSTAMHQLDKPATRLVAEILQDIAFWQRSIKWDEESLKGMRRLAIERPGSEWEKYRNVSRDDWLRDHYPHNPEFFVYRELPPFTKDTVSEWWEKAVKPYLEKASTLTKIRDTPFYESLRKATATGKDYEIRDELKRRCKPKLRTLAKPA